MLKNNSDFLLSKFLPVSPIKSYRLIFSIPYFCQSLFLVKKLCFSLCTRSSANSLAWHLGLFMIQPKTVFCFLLLLHFHMFTFPFSVSDKLTYLTSYHHIFCFHTFKSLKKKKDKKEMKIS